MSTLQSRSAQEVGTSSPATPGQAPGPGGVDPLDFPAEQTNSSGVMKGMFVIGAGLGICGAGLMLKALAGSEPSQPVPQTAAATSPLVDAMSQQAEIMREAMNMAKQAQQMQRERLDMLRQEMEMGERAAEGVLPAGLGE